jgi:hypothetical protein
VDSDEDEEIGDDEVPDEDPRRTRRRSGALTFQVFIWKVLKSTRVPVTKLGRLVKDGKVKSMEEIYLFSLPVREFQIIDIFLPALKDEVMSIKPVQKQTSAGQRTRFQAFVAVGDSDG